MGNLNSTKEERVAEGAVLPAVSVVVVNYRGADDTLECLRALREDLDYPAELLQVICVDNASGDDSVERLTGAGAELVQAQENLGFAGGCNLGAKRAKGSVLAFLNNDARPHRDWVRAAVKVLRDEPTVGAVASKVLDWDGTRIDFVDGGLTWFGMGYKRHAGELDDGSHDRPRDVLFGTGSAMFVRAGLYRELGGFDERFFMFYEDVDLGWRINLRGWRFHYEPTSLAYHRHHASMSTLDSSREHYLLERNALAALYKNASDTTLAAVLPAALALTVRRATARGEVDTGQLEITARPAEGEDDSAPIALPRSTVAGLLAIDQFVEMLPSLRESRAVEQAARTRSDADLLPLMRNPLERASAQVPYLTAHEAIVEALGVDRLYGQRRAILILTSDTITERMAGPAIRAWNMADVLAQEHDVQLVTLNAHFNPPEAPFPVSYVPPGDAGELVDWADIVILQGHVLEQVPILKTASKVVVCDIYDPMHLEQLEQGRDLADKRRAHVLEVVTQVLSNQLERGDFFLCASERQRHFWLGHLGAIGRLSPVLYDADPTVRSLLAVAPFGLAGKPPVRTAPAARGVLPGIGENDKVVIWAGGVYSWFDPLTLLHAVDLLRAEHDDVRLLFLGMKHPNPDVGEMDMAGQTRRLADQLGIVGSHVFFNENWVPYGERQNWLLDADCGVTTHYEHIETTFAFRTRVLDYLWAGLPIVTTDGDSFADLVRAEKLGVVVPSEDPLALAEALRRGALRRGVQPGVQGTDRRGPRPLHLGDRPRAAGGLLPQPAPRGRPARRVGGVDQRPAAARGRRDAPRCRAGAGVPGLRWTGRTGQTGGGQAAQSRWSATSRTALMTRIRLKVLLDGTPLLGSTDRCRPLHLRAGGGTGLDVRCGHARGGVHLARLAKAAHGAAARLAGQGDAGVGAAAAPLLAARAVPADRAVRRVHPHRARHQLRAAARVAGSGRGDHPRPGLPGRAGGTGQGRREPAPAGGCLGRAGRRRVHADPGGRREGDGTPRRRRGPGHGDPTGRRPWLVHRPPAEHRAARQARPARRVPAVRRRGRAAQGAGLAAGRARCRAAAPAARAGRTGPHHDERQGAAHRLSVRCGPA